MTEPGAVEAAKKRFTDQLWIAANEPDAGAPSQVVQNLRPYLRLQSITRTAGQHVGRAGKAALANHFRTVNIQQQQASESCAGLVRSGYDGAVNYLHWRGAAPQPAPGRLLESEILEVFADLLFEQRTLAERQLYEDVGSQSPGHRRVADATVDYRHFGAVLAFWDHLKQRSEFAGLTFARWMNVVVARA